jgi:hypothetical protein
MCTITSVNILPVLTVSCTQDFFRRGGGCSTNSIEDRGQIERGSGGGSFLVKVSAQFANWLNPCSYWVVRDVFSTEPEIRPSCVKTSEFRGV